MALTCILTWFYVQQSQQTVTISLTLEDQILLYFFSFQGQFCWRMASRSRTCCSCEICVIFRPRFFSFFRFPAVSWSISWQLGVHVTQPGRQEQRPSEICDSLTRCISNRSTTLSKIYKGYIYTTAYNTGDTKESLCLTLLKMIHTDRALKVFLFHINSHWSQKYPFVQRKQLYTPIWIYIHT